MERFYNLLIFNILLRTILELIIGIDPNLGPQLGRSLSGDVYVI